MSKNSLVITDSTLGKNKVEPKSDADFANHYYKESKEESSEKVNSDITPDGWVKIPTLTELKNLVNNIHPIVNNQVRKISKWEKILKNPKSKTNNKENISTLTSSLAQTHANWRYSSLSESYLSEDKLFTLECSNAESNIIAQQNEKILNWQFKTNINLINFFDSLVKRVVNQGTAFIKIGWKVDYQEVEEDLPSFTYYPIQQPEQLEQFNQLIQQLNSSPELYYKLPIEQRKSVEYFLETNVPVVVLTEPQKVKYTKPVSGYPTLNFVDVNNLYVDPTCKGDFSKASFVIHKYETNKSNILSNSDAYLYSTAELTAIINTYVSTNDSVSDVNSLDLYDGFAQNFDYEDKARKKIVIYEYWGEYDIYNTGKLQQIVVSWLGDKIIRLALNPFPDKKIPFVNANYLYQIDSVYGNTDAESLGDLQNTKDNLLRAIVTVYGKRAVGQRGIPEGMLSAREMEKFTKGMDYKYSENSNPKDQIVDHNIQPIDNGVYNFLQTLNDEAESATGVKAFSTGMSQNSFSPVATSTKAMLNAAGTREMSITRRISNAVTEIGKKILLMNSKFLSDDNAYQILQEKFIRLDNASLYSLFNLSVSVESTEITQSKLQSLTFLLQTFSDSPELKQIMLAEYCRLNKMYYLQKKIENYNPQPDPIQQQLAQLQLEKEQALIDKAKAETQLAIARARKEDSSADNSDLNFVEQENGTSHARRLEELQAQSEGNQKLALLKGAIAENSKKADPKKIPLNTKPKIPEINQNGDLNQLPRVQGVPRDPDITGLQD